MSWAYLGAEVDDQDRVAWPAPLCEVLLSVSLVRCRSSH